MPYCGYKVCLHTTFYHVYLVMKEGNKKSRDLVEHLSLDKMGCQGNLDGGCARNL